MTIWQNTENQKDRGNLLPHCQKKKWEKKREAGCKAGFPNQVSANFKEHSETKSRG